MEFSQRPAHPGVHHGHGFVPAAAPAAPTHYSYAASGEPKYFAEPGYAGTAQSQQQRRLPSVSELLVSQQAAQQQVALQHQHYQQQHQQRLSFMPGTRAKRPRVGDHAASAAPEEQHYSSAETAPGSAYRSTVFPPPVAATPVTPTARYHHSVHALPAHASLPPMRSSGVATAETQSRAGGTPGSSSAMPPSGPNLMRPRSDTVGKTSGTLAEQQSATTAIATRNTEAAPTQAWLAGQRQYKIALLHLLTLESFYPSDVAMLNMFRSQNDFTQEEVEAHSSTLLSWARGWLRYNRNAVLRSTLENKARSTLTQLAEALQHDLHAEEDFTTPANLRRCALLRLIYFQWQSINKLGTKSQSLYRDYENKLREIEALGSFEEQENEWMAIIQEEQSRRLALIRESRGAVTRSDGLGQGASSSTSPSGGTHMGLSQQMQQHQHQQQQQQYSAAGYPPSQQQTYQQRLAMSSQQSVSATLHVQQRSAHRHLPLQQVEYYHHHRHVSSGEGASGPASRDSGNITSTAGGGGSGEQAATLVGKDDDSDMSVKLSPE
ncbi:hypothetical protein GGI07_000732 [Coemansia sp. Benny D115]|nr:hypothetical protein GGI07_000732 [Coemansia sp. Benny D115]